MFTPKQEAYDIAISWLRNAYEGKTNDIDATPARARDIRRQVAKLHNRLMAAGKLDGLPLNEEVTL